MASSTIDPPSTQISELSMAELREECQECTQISVQEKKMFMDVIDLITNSLREMKVGECETWNSILKSKPNWRVHFTNKPKLSQLKNYIL